MRARFPLIHYTGIALFIFFALFIPALSYAKSVFQFSANDPNYYAALSVAAVEGAEADVDVEEKVTLDEDFNPEDFGFEEVGALPSSPLYFLKDWGRGTRSFFTFGRVEKAELRLEYAAQKLLEAKELALVGDADSEDVARAIRNFGDELNRVREVIARVSKEEDAERSQALARSLMDSVFKYQKLLGKLEKDLPPDSFQDVHDAKTRTSETFNSVFALIDAEEVVTELDDVLERQKGSELKHFKNLEVLKEVKEKAPPEARKALTRAEDRALERLEGELKKFDTAQGAVLEDFIREIGGNEVRQLEVLAEMEARPLDDEMREAVLAAKEELFIKTESRIQALSGVNPALRARLIAHLGDGNFEDVRILKELEGNVSDESLPELKTVTASSTQGLVWRLQTASQDNEEREGLLDSVGRYHDARMFSVFQEMEELIPEKDRELFSVLKQRAVSEIERDIASASDGEERRARIKAVAGDRPEYLEALSDDNDFGSLGSAIADGIRNALFENAEVRIRNIRDEGRLEKFEQEFRIRDTAGQEARFRVIFDERRDIFHAPNRAFEAIDHAEEVINELRREVESLPYEEGYDGFEFDVSLRDINRMLILAERKLQSAFDGVSIDDIGRGFADAEAARSLAEEGMHLAEEYREELRDIELAIEEEEDDERVFITEDEDFEDEDDNNFFEEERERPDNWVTHEWEFRDGSTVKSQILDRSDTEYLGYITQVERQCLAIDRAHFDWNRFAGDDSPENWKNFGIPDCSGETTAVPVTYGDCRDNGSEAACYAQPGCEWFGTYCDGGDAVPHTEQGCFYPDAQVDGEPAGFTVWCEEDYFNCHEGEESGAVVSLDGLTLGAPSWCASDEHISDVGPADLYNESSCTDAGYHWCVEDGHCYSNIDVCTENNAEEHPEADCRFIADSEQCTQNEYCKWFSLHNNVEPYCEAYNWYAGDENSCPEFAHSEFDSWDARYCKLNDREACAYSYPDYLKEENYFAVTCPSDARPEPTDSTNGTEENAGQAENNWTLHTWTFKDGSTETSYIFDRTDQEYTDFIASVEGQCKQIEKYQFYWDRDAGITDSTNWRHFGIPNCSGDGTTSTTDTTDTNTSGGTTTDGHNTYDTSEMYSCFYPGAVINGEPAGFTVWCEYDYQNCHEGEESGASVSLDGLELGAPSSCESGWDGNYSDSCNYNHYCDSWESSASCPEDCGGGGGTGQYCYNYGDQATCQESGCIWYDNHYDGTHCDDAAHGDTSTSGGGYGNVCSDTNTLSALESFAPGKSGWYSGGIFSENSSWEVCIDGTGESVAFVNNTSSRWNEVEQYNSQYVHACSNYGGTHCPNLTGSYGGDYGACDGYTDQSSCTSTTNCHWSSSSNYCFYDSSTCSESPYLCSSESACTGSGYYWCNSECYGNQDSCPAAASGGGYLANVMQALRFLFGN